MLLGAVLLLAGCLQVELHPTEAEKQHFDNGVTFAEQGRFDEAISEFTKALETDPRWAMAYYNRGLCYFNTGQYDLAIADYSKAIKLDPNFVEAYVNRGWTYDNMGQWDLAIADCNKAIELDPNIAAAYINRGWAYASKGQHDLAIADFSKAIELEPNNADAYYNRGLVYKEQGKMAEAMADLEECIELSLDPSLSRAAQSLLEELRTQPLPPRASTESLTYSNSDYRFSVEYPSDWDVYEDILGTVVFFAGPLVVDTTCYSHISMVVDELPYENVTHEDFVNMVVSQLTTTLQDCRLAQEYSAAIDGMPAVVLVFTYTGDFGGENVTVREEIVVLVKDKLYYLLKYVVPAEFYEDYADCFELAKSSFRFD